MKKILMIGNAIFIPVEYGNGFPHHILYLGGSVAGLCFGKELYTEEQVRAKYPDVKEVEKGFLGVNEAYYGKPRAIKDML